LINLPNSLTLARIFLVPLLAVVLLTGVASPSILGVPKEIIAAGIFALASLTDWLDGYLARRRRQVTTLGQLMDPVADKLLTTAAFVSLVQMDVASAWMVAIIIGRELAVTGLRGIAQARGLTISASPLGKLKMGSQVATILLLLLGRAHVPGFLLLGQIGMWVVMLIALVSALDYYRRFAVAMAPGSPIMTDFEAAREATQKRRVSGL
jgi:CDP-diacylglycerol---glycerol-3-phosphate 3-phosphatidyltransferase